MKQKLLLQVKNLDVQSSGKVVLRNVSFTINEGECLAIVGASGSGKSSLIKALAAKYSGDVTIKFEKKEDGKVPLIISILQQHHFKNLSNTTSFYYQQRFNSFDSEDAEMVNDVLQGLTDDEDAIQAALELLGIAYMRYTRLIQLSNGEHKRFQLAKAILRNADWLLLDSPYTGLDIVARGLMNSIIDKLVANGMRILLVTPLSDMPSCVTHIALLEDGELKAKFTREAFIQSNYKIKSGKKITSLDYKLLKELLPAYSYEEFSVAIKMVDTSIVYNNRQILANINWKVNRGECWRVSGHNGSGKSTLLSLVTGDNPQAFANEIYLFDRRKGSGESIWDIKQKIGYVSPELHHYFESCSTCFDVVASGLFDTIGLFKKLNEKQISLVNEWMKLLKINDFEKRRFNQLSNGEQRLVLLARALIKNPPMLILDEPCQGLDKEASESFISLINDICVQTKKTLVYVSHYEEEIPSCVTYTLKLEQGKIAA